MTQPIPGFAYPNPRTWSAGDFLTTPRLRGDLTNIGYLFAGGVRPMLLAGNFSSQTWAGSTVQLQIGNVVPLNTWNVNVISAGGPSVVPYHVPLAGWWLLQGDVTMSTGATPQQSRFGMGFQTVVNGAASSPTDGGMVPASTAAGGAGAGSAGMELLQFNTFANTGDQFNLYGFTDAPGGAFQIGVSFLMAEWVGLPTSGLTSYTGPYGTPISGPPYPASPWPSGQGTTITNGPGIAAGATSVTVADATGMLVNGTLGLDVINAQFQQPYAEQVTITSVTGLTIGITACKFSHASGAPVAVPVGSLFLNQQARDIVYFLSYPPMMRAQTTGAQSIPSTAYPTGTQITNLSANLDNYTGFASNVYTVPVSGCYLVYGQVYVTGSTSVFSMGCGVQQNSGTISWGTVFRSATTSAADLFCATYRRVLRCKAGDTLKLIGFQNSGAAMNTFASGSQFSKFMVVFRSF